MTEPREISGRDLLNGTGENGYRNATQAVLREVAEAGSWADLLVAVAALQNIQFLAACSGSAEAQPRSAGMKP